MATPSGLLDHRAQMCANFRLEFVGGIVWRHLPCPFCAAPDWIVYDEPQMEQIMMRPQGHLCGECGRRGKLVLGQIEGCDVGELVQMSGADAPDWLVPRIPRLQ